MDVGLQVRWSIVMESIILQVVGNLGKHYYLRLFYIFSDKVFIVRHLNFGLIIKWTSETFKSTAKLSFSILDDFYIKLFIVGSDMYMAFGVKENNPGNNAAAQGDVVVGWINSQTGRGGLDDYFLSGAHTCSDGAESCPDTSKPGGQKNVEMLNSVSRDNYTMITFKR